MGALIALISRLGSSLLRLLGSLGSNIGWGNIAGWTLAALIPAAYIAIWVGVLTYAFSAVVTWFIGSSAQVFDTSFPSGAMWLLNQTFPLALMFGSAVSLLVFRVSAAFLLSAAIAASRYLKGK